MSILVHVVTLTTLHPCQKNSYPTAKSTASRPAALPQPSREPIHITVIGPAIGIDLVVKTLHHLGFAEPRAWSKLQNDPNTGRPMRILTKWLRY